MPLVRCLTVWMLTTAAVVVVPLGLAPELRAARALADPADRASVPFDALLAIAAAIALTACAVWFWVVTTLVVGQAMTGRVRSVHGCPDGVRRLLFAACGLALVATAAPAAADSTAGRPPAPDDSYAVSGLPLPDRVAIDSGEPSAVEPSAVEPGAVEPSAVEPSAVQPSADKPSAVPPNAVKPGASRPGAFHLVRSGDTLWGIAADSLPGSATDAHIDQRWRDIWSANRSAVGSDPDLIRPGAVLHLPPEEES